MSILSIISTAIKQEDTTYFFENYTSQARAVMRALEKNGYRIVKKEPTLEMIKAGVKAINLGNVDARQLAKDIFSDMIDT
ncbi:MAG: hypothetical protein SFT93_00865 [Rickettsiaceae bacterium]|nr:hypothetical protein [Rickettsiaceae bacterium]